MNDRATNLHTARVCLAEALVDEVGGRSGIVAVFEEEGDIAAVPDEVELVAYRVAQEALSNAVQHGGAEHIRVRLLGAGSQLELRISDDGAGFEASASRAGLGIAGMRERALLSRARLTIEPATPHGTEVRLELPQPPPPNGATP